jgi:3-hydroxyisobutyrate dehydrogenase-like beta-hydroxyacid dehydrogenase
MRIAVLGMGRMGQALGGRLLGSGHELVIWNRTAGKAEDLVEKGAEEAKAISEAVEGAEIVVTSLTDDEAVREVACGDDGVRESLPEGSVYVDVSTISPTLSGELDDSFPRFVAMPILGGPEAVATGRAIYLLGGKADAVVTVNPLFPGLSEKVFRYNSPPLASTAKVAVNLLLLDGVVALAESFAVGRAGGLSDDQLRDLLGENPMVAPGLKNRFEGVLTGDQEPWWAAALGAKDAGLAIEIVRAAGGDIPATVTVRERYEKAASNDSADVAEVSRLYRS